MNTEEEGRGGRGREGWRKGGYGENEGRREGRKGEGKSKGKKGVREGEGVSQQLEQINFKCDTCDKV